MDAVASDQSNETLTDDLGCGTGTASARSAVAGLVDASATSMVTGVATTVSGVHAAVDVLAVSDLTRCGHRELDVLAGAAQRVRGFLAAADARIARRRDEIWQHPSDHDPGHGPDGDGGRDDPGSGANGGVANGGVDAGGTGGDAGSGSGDHLGSGLTESLVNEFANLGDRRSGNDSGRDHTRARTGSSMPSFEAALARGAIDTAHIDAVGAALGRLADDADAYAEFIGHETALLGHAAVERPDRFRRRCTDLARRISRDHGLRHAERQKAAATVKNWWDRNGMWHVHAELDPETGSQVLAALDAHLESFRAGDEAKELTWDRLRVESFVRLITSSAAVEPRVPEIIAIVDWKTLTTGTFDHDSICETSAGAPLPPATARRLACEANIIPVVVDPDGKPFDHGRTRRLASRKQRRALRLMYRTCGHPDCHVAFDRCRIHHITWWEHDGPTDLQNLIPVCSRHHHQVHEGGWTLTMTPDRVTTWITPGGMVWYTGDTRDRMPCDRIAAPPDDTEHGKRRELAEHSEEHEPAEHGNRREPAVTNARRDPADTGVRPGSHIDAEPGPIPERSPTPTPTPTDVRQPPPQHRQSTGSGQPALFSHDTEPAGP